MPTETDEQLAAALGALRKKRKASHRPRYYKSRLDRYRSQLETLQALGASFEEMAVWLRKHKRTRVATSTVWRVFRRWERLDEALASTRSS
jgi:adenosyl cobinamide kinase/adenosyl cobinamide phosphate guanylyltransferase